MTHVAQLFVAFAAVHLLATLSVTAEAPKERVRTEAVVQKFETEAMEDLLNNGRFFLYDALTLKIISPEKLAGNTLRVYFPSGSVADPSPIRKPGQRCRFDFDTNLLKADVIFSGALDNLQWVRSDGGVQQSSGQSESESVKDPSIDERLLFYPSKYPAGNWTPDDLQFEDVWFAAQDQTRLHGWYCPSASPRATILIAHGNAGNIASRIGWLRYLQSKMRVSTFIFDYRGYGRSEGTPTVEGALQDARAARMHLSAITGLEDSEMLLMGESLGGAIVVRLAAESSPRGLILQSTFSSLRDVADVRFPKVSWLVPPAKLNSAKQISRFHGPLFQSHGKADKTVPFASGEKLFQSANQPKTFVAIDGAGHNNWFTPEYLRRLDDFINDVARREKSKGYEMPNKAK